jgi:hypothetical protein
MTCLDAPLGGLMETTSGHFGQEYDDMQDDGGQQMDLEMAEVMEATKEK